MFFTPCNSAACARQRHYVSSMLSARCCSWPSGSQWRHYCRIPLAALPTSCFSSRSSNQDCITGTHMPFLLPQAPTLLFAACVCHMFATTLCCTMLQQYVQRSEMWMLAFSLALQSSICCGANLRPRREQWCHASFANLPGRNYTHLSCSALQLASTLSHLLAQREPKRDCQCQLQQSVRK